MKNLLFLIFLTVMPGLYAQRYQPHWASLDKRPVPEWFSDAKFGIFIHWGVYSVPSWGPTGDSIGVYNKYAEWYWWRLREPGPVRKYFQAFHNKTYGPNFKYQDFAPMFRAELFQPDKWAELFKAAGAKYVVLTSKHHEGFTLWPSEQSWNWNSVDVGPHRDLCGELSEAVKEAGLHMGFYYSLYEWYDPLYKKDLSAYVDQHMIPQMKDLVTRYTPDILWTDGEWEHTSAAWKSEEFLAWLFNSSPVKDNVAVNDRWGSDTRSRHGGFYTTEYGLVGDSEGIENEKPHPWEECRGIGTSFGYNRNENFDDYSSAKQLITLLVSTVSSGGNLLLDIGPTSDGRIPVIMQQRLVEIGKWLSTNGEAIYHTRPFIRTQKAEAIHPEINKTLFFTRKGDILYLITTDWPEENITLQGVNPAGEVHVRMSGSDREVRSVYSGGTLTIIPPAPDPEEVQPAYVFKITGLL